MKTPKKLAMLGLAALLAFGAFIAAPSAEAHGRDRDWGGGWRDRGGWRGDRGNHYGWRNNHRGGWGDGPRHRYASWGGRHRGYDSYRGGGDRHDRRYYR